MVQVDADGNEFTILEDGTKVGFGAHLRPDVVTATKPLFPVIPQANWPKKDRTLDRFMPFRWNQGPQNSCGGHAAGALQVIGWEFALNKILEFSPSFAYSQVNRGRDAGSGVYDYIDSLREGTCLFSTIGPYNIMANRYPQSAYDEAKLYRMNRGALFFTIEEGVSYILRRQPVMIGFYTGKNFKPDKNGLLPEWDGVKVGGHLTAHLGIEYIPGRGWGTWLLNSWGPKWGINGMAWAPFSYTTYGAKTFGGMAFLSARKGPL